MEPIDGTNSSQKSRKRPITDYLYVILSALTYGLFALFRGSFGPITDILESEFNTTSTGIGILSSSLYITYVIVQIPWGLFLQIFTCQLALIISIFSLSILSLIFPFTAYSANNSLIFGSIIRAFSGALCAQVWVVGVTIGGQKFGNNYVSLCGAIILLTATLYVFIGNIIQAQLYEKYNQWKVIYYAISILSFINTLILLWCMYKEKKNTKQTSFRRLSMSTTNNLEVNNIDKLSICQQLKVNSQQTVKMHLNWVLAIFGFCYGTIFWGALGLWSIPYLIVKFGYSRSVAALISGFTVLTAGLSSIGCGECSRRIKRRKIFLIIGSVLFSSFVILIYIPMMPMYVVIILAILTGIAAGCSPILFTLSREYNWYYGNAETASALVNTLIACSGFFGQYTIGALLDLSYEKRNIDDVNINENRNYSVDDYNFAFIVVPICLGILLILSLLVKETYGINIDYGDNTQNANNPDSITNVNQDQ